MQQKYCVTFAGVPGSSKTPTATYLSYQLSLSLFNNDTIRTEVTEDLLAFDENEFRRRARERLRQLIDSGQSFIYDASVDRRWADLADLLEPAGYRTFLISFDLSSGFLTNLYKSKDYKQGLECLDERQREHTEFLDKYGSTVNLRIDDNSFADRLEVARQALASWLVA